MGRNANQLAAAWFAGFGLLAASVFFLRPPLKTEIIVLYLGLPTCCAGLAGYLWGAPILDFSRTESYSRALLRGVGVTLRAYLIFCVLFACAVPLFETLWSPRQIGSLFVFTLVGGFVMVGPIALFAGMAAGTTLYGLARRAAPGQSATDASKGEWPK